MADIILAERMDRFWLVGGGRYIDQLLGNTLPPDVSIEFVVCQSDSEVQALWLTDRGEERQTSQPWMLNPGIVARIRRGVATTGSVMFGPWSAMLDDEANLVIASCAARLTASSDMTAVLICYVADGAPRPVADIAGLRASLIEAELTRLGIAAARIARETRDPATVPGMAAESQRVDIVLQGG